MTNLDEKVTVGVYLFTRLQQLGVRAICGVPGDYNLTLLDLIDEVPGLFWVGNDSELNSAYAADGYAQGKEGLGALITTFGVGELSALCGVAGAYAEHVPVVHIVGLASTVAKENHLLMHHTLADGKYDTFVAMSDPIIVASTVLDNPKTAGSEIDRVLRSAVVKNRPVYIGIPTDKNNCEISAASLRTPIDVSLRPENPLAQEEALEAILSKFRQASNAIFVIDKQAIRYHCSEEVVGLVEKTGFPVYTTAFGKGTVPEDIPQFKGTYIGAISAPEIINAVGASDLVFTVGSVKGDLNGGLTYNIQAGAEIEVKPTYCRVGGKTYDGIVMKSLLGRLLERIDPTQLRSKRAVLGPLPDIEEDMPGTKITHAWFWKNLGSNFLRPYDLVVVETGSSQLGILNVHLPKEVQIVSSLMWGSIGYATAATLGAALAARELSPKRRTILFTGDGSLQLTAQSIATMIRNKLTPILFVLNNDGYTIERYIHGFSKEYNHIAEWRYTKLLDTFGSNDYSTYYVETREQMERLFADPKFTTASRIQLVEVRMDFSDAPVYLKEFSKFMEKLTS